MLGCVGIDTFCAKLTNYRFSLLKCKMPNCFIGLPRRKDRKPLFRRLCALVTPVPDANLCHTDANHCHRALMAEKKSLLPLYSLPKP